MKKSNICFSILISICIILTLIYAPSYIITNADRNILHEWRAGDIESYSGIINVWHIIGFKAHSGSTSFWLNARAVEFENRHKNIFVNIMPMDIEEYQTKLHSGEKPDMLSYPLGLEYSDAFIEINESIAHEIESKINPHLHGSGKYDGVYYSLPYFYSGYVLLLNIERINHSQILFSEEISKEQIQEANDKLFIKATAKKKRVYGISGNIEVAALLGLECEFGNYEDFLYNNSGMAIADFRAVGDMERLNMNGKGIICEAKPITKYTNQVQLIGISSDINSEKVQFALEFIQDLYTKKAQSDFFEMNLYSAIDIPFSDDRTLSGIALDCYELYKNPVVPNSFLYKRYSNALHDDAIRVLTGDVEGRKAFINRINEMLINPMEFT